MTLTLFVCVGAGLVLTLRLSIGFDMNSGRLGQSVTSSYYRQRRQLTSLPEVSGHHPIIEIHSLIARAEYRLFDDVPTLSTSDFRNHQQLHKSQKYNDPRTVIEKEDGGGVLMTSSLYVVPEIYLEESKLMVPAIVQSRPPEYDHQGLVVDVLSVGSRSRPEYVSIVSSFYNFLISFNALLRYSSLHLPLLDVRAN